MDTQRVERAVAYFKRGYNCSQSVAMAFADRYGIPVEQMARIAASYGGGIGRMRETCGTALGMFLLCGLEEVAESDVVDPSTGQLTDYSPLTKKHNYEIVQRLAAEFKAETGSLICRELLGLNKRRADGTLPEIKIVATPDARTDEYYKKRPCVRMVETAATIFQRYLDEKEQSV